MLATYDMRHGLKVVTETGEWEVLDRHPLNRHWWLHRWNRFGQWETDYAHENEMTAVAGELAEAVTERAKWGKCPFNTSGAEGPVRQVGYALGKWGTYKVKDWGWRVVHLPTGLSVPTHELLGHSPTLKEVKGLVEKLAADSFPLLDEAGFGAKVGNNDDVRRLRKMLLPEVGLAA